ncbi:flagellar hook-associated protein 2 [Inhella inkyongensis]|uniref:Flagellar hook-associated protein 2 n=1 Tax=Inhella inkyongensis TaxID=392593 RepID=A0A840SC47_9BURK|nr:flagellar filament capping protein FliD [Inhella inkyongensis]MBB5205909.1 flagellar hook-associated protein 2 [Inhella inkyongensis]
MATITSAGIGSGLDVETLISRLVAAERAPISQLQQRTTGLKTQLSAYGKLQASMASLRDAAAKLSRTDTFGAVTAASSDPTLVSVSASNGAPAGNYSVKVDRLAAAQSIATPAIPSGSALGSGTIQIDFGKYLTDDQGNVNFDADPSRTSLIIPIVSGEEQLEKVRDKINAMKAGIVASVVSDANGSRLVMRGIDPGAANAFRVTVADDDGIPDDNTGLSALAFDASTGVNTSNLKQAAQNAKATVDGIEIESASNVITGAVEGLTLTLNKVSADSATVTVGQDKAALKKNITDFVSAYNSAISLLRDQSKYDPGSKTAGPLQGDSAVTSMQNQLRTLVSSSTSLGGSLSRLAQIGLDPGSDGQLKIDNTKLDAAIDKPSDLKGLLSGLDSSDAGNNGLAQRLRTLADNFLGSQGRLELRQKGIQERIEANADREAQLEQRIQLVEKRLRAQYTALDGTMSKAQGLSTYLSQQLQKL